MELKSQMAAHRGTEAFGVPVTWWCYKKDSNLKMQSIFLTCGSSFPSVQFDITYRDIDLVQVAPTSSKQHGVNVGVNASATPFQQASGYGSHGYSTGEALNHI